MILADCQQKIYVSQVAENTGYNNATSYIGF